jgi:guanosine-3',5'-bis(diphosphate) 3'-pyrophosphohydrolase
LSKRYIKCERTHGSAAAYDRGDVNVLNGKYKKKLDELLLVCKNNLPSVDESLIQRAFEYGFEAHKHDMRASGEPYFNHPYEVAMIVAKEVALDDISVASALLHDVVEDTEYGVEGVREEFGDTIANIVDGATKITDIFRSHEVTQAESYRKMLLSMVNDIRVMLIKFADRLHNMRTLEYLPVERQQRLARETLDIYAPFAHRFGLARIRWELEDLSFKYLDRKAYEEVSKSIKAKRREREHYIKKFVAPIEKRLKDEGFAFEIGGRPKHLYSIHNKMASRGKPLDEIYDLFAVRIILETDNPNDCFAAYGIVSETYIPIPERFKDYISIPKKNGYQSIHTTVVGPEGKMVEVQIRTRAMHEVAEKGVAAHWKYKENVAALDKELEDWVNWVREIFEQHAAEETPKELIESFKLNLYQDEIYVFTPKGELKILPKGSTPVDFAFEIHSEIGFHCIGAKVNGRIVPLNVQLRSGDQIEIITSKNQVPNPDWEQFVVTHKAKAHIRRWIREEARKISEKGKAIWDKRLKKSHTQVTEEDFSSLLSEMKAENPQEFYYRVGSGSLDLERTVAILEGKSPSEGELEVAEREKKGNIFSSFVRAARSSLEGILVEGKQDRFMHVYAKCCNPIPGDEIVGFVTVGEGIKIHRKNCKNVAQILASEAPRIVEVGWPTTDGATFIAGIKVTGKDKPGMLHEIAHSISTLRETNIRGVNIDSKDSFFEGSIIVYVKNTEHLQQIIDKLRKLDGIYTVERFEE